MVLHSFKDDRAAVGGNIKTPNVEVCGDLGQLALGAGFQINEPEILVLNVTAQEDERAPSGEER